LGIGGVYQQNPNYYFLPIFYSFAFGPLLYFYVKQLTDNAFTWRPHYLLHFLPAFLQGGLYVFLQTQDYEFRRWFWFDVHRDYTQRIEFLLTLVSLLIYCYFSFRFVQRYQHLLREHYSEISKINLQWLKFILSSIIVIATFWGIDLYFREILGLYLDHNFSSIGLGIFVLMLALGSIRQNSLTHIDFSDSDRPKVQTSREKEIDPNTLETIQKRIKDDQLYLEPELSLKDFSKLIGIPARTISEHLNQGLGLSFIDFVNQHRVEAVKEAILNNELEHKTFLGIALDSGFNSKATFNRVFKKMTETTPGQYHKNLQKPQ
ncbi:MAG: helix-turn-helix domain-containing protein, partial [Bacteroidota bacterium]